MQRLRIHQISVPSSCRLFLNGLQCAIRKYARKRRLWRLVRQRRRARTGLQLHVGKSVKWAADRPVCQVELWYCTALVFGVVEWHGVGNIGMDPGEKRMGHFDCCSWIMVFGLDGINRVFSSFLVSLLVSPWNAPARTREGIVESCGQEP